jgi:hypothetical protein
MNTRRMIAYALRLLLTLFVYGFTYMAGVRVFHLPEIYAVGLAAIMTLAFLLPPLVRKR